MCRTVVHVLHVRVEVLQIILILSTTKILHDIILTLQAAGGSAKKVYKAEAMEKIRVSLRPFEQQEQQQLLQQRQFLQQQQHLVQLQQQQLQQLVASGQLDEDYARQLLLQAQAEALAASSGNTNGGVVPAVAKHLGPSPVPPSTSASPAPVQQQPPALPPRRNPAVAASHPHVSWDRSRTRPPTLRLPRLRPDSPRRLRRRHLEVPLLRRLQTRSTTSRSSCAGCRPSPCRAPCPSRPPRPPARPPANSR